MGGGGRYPYPKDVWSPAGGWWVQPHNWRTNTAIVLGGVLLVTYGVWQLSAEKEWRHTPPRKPIPSMMWAKQYRDQQQPPSESKDAS